MIEKLKVEDRRKKGRSLPRFSLNYTQGTQRGEKRRQEEEEERTHGKTKREGKKAKKK